MNNKFIKYPLILFIVAGLCASAITATYVYTNPILEKRQEENTKKNLEQLYDNTKSFKILFEESQLEDSTLLAVYEVLLNDNTSRIVYQTSSKGKNGDIVSLISFNKNKIDKIKNIAHNETPGIGAKIDEESYLDSITKQDINKMNVDTISGATFSSTALKKSVEAAIVHYEKEVNK